MALCTGSWTKWRGLWMSCAGWQKMWDPFAGLASWSQDSPTGTRSTRAASGSSIRQPLRVCSGLLKIPTAKWKLTLERPAGFRPSSTSVFFLRLWLDHAMSTALVEAEKLSELLELPTGETCNFLDQIEVKAQSWHRLKFQWEFRSF